MQFVARAPAWRQFAAWALCGASAAFILVGAFAVGPLAIVPTALGALLALRLGGSNVSAVGAAAGVGSWGFVLGWLNRDGPWPYLVVGAVLVGGSAGVFVHGRRRVRRHRAYE
jgi:hypothetical protein